MAVYVYSIVGKRHPLRLDGVTGIGEPPSELRTVTEGSLCAVVSDAPDDLRPKRRDLTAHQEVQNRLMADGAVLPLRFGLTAEDDEAVRAALEASATEYVDKLQALESCTEYHLKVSQDEDALLRQILADSSEARELNDEIRSGAAGRHLARAGRAGREGGTGAPGRAGYRRGRSAPSVCSGPGDLAADRRRFSQRLVPGVRGPG